MKEQELGLHSVCCLAVACYLKTFKLKLRQRTKNYTYFQFCFWILGAVTYNLASPKRLSKFELLSLDWVLIA